MLATALSESGGRRLGSTAPALADAFRSRVGESAVTGVIAPPLASDSIAASSVRTIARPSRAVARHDLPSSTQSANASACVISGSDRWIAGM